MTQSDRRLPYRWIPLVCLVLVFAVITGIIWRIWNSNAMSRLKPGKETSLLTELLTTGGHIDFAEVLHRRSSSGVNPSDNAAVLIDQAFGPRTISPDLRKQYFQRIGVDPLPEHGSYVQTQIAFINHKRRGFQPPPNSNDATIKEFKQQQLKFEKALHAEFQLAQHQPWTKGDCPSVAEWLELNSVPLKLIEQATTRSQFYSPLVSAQGLFQAESTLQNVREAIRMMMSRAMWRMGQKNGEGAWSDLLACQRLVYLVSQRAPTINSFLMATSLDHSASRQVVVLVAEGLSSEQARKCLADHSALLPLTPLSDVLDQRHRIAYLEGLLEQPLTRLEAQQILNHAYPYYDDLVSATRLPHFTQRKQALTKIEESAKKRIVDAHQKGLLTADHSSKPSAAVAQSHTDFLFSMLLPVVIQTDVTQTKAECLRDLTRIGLALAAYHAERGTYPETLQPLVPGYVKAIPDDRFSDQPLKYVPRQNGFLLSSLGANGREDGVDIDPTSNDDVAFEIPPKVDD